jgi:hypothetical protein
MKVKTNETNNELIGLYLQKVIDLFRFKSAYSVRTKNEIPPAPAKANSDFQKISV